MPPRKTTDFGALFESLIEDLRIQVAASFDQSLSEIEKRIARIEKRLDQLDPSQAAPSTEEASPRRACSVCGKPSVARGLCSAHYQQWRYRVRKAKAREEAESHDERRSEEKEPTLVFAPVGVNVSHNN